MRVCVRERERVCVCVFVCECVYECNNCRYKDSSHPVGAFSVKEIMFSHTHEEDATDLFVCIHFLFVKLTYFVIFKVI